MKQTGKFMIKYIHLEMYSSGSRGRTRNAIGLYGCVGSNPTVSANMFTIILIELGGLFLIVVKCFTTCYNMGEKWKFLELKMLEVKFYDNVDDNLLKFAVIISKTNGKWVFCKHKKRNTYEIPGGHREMGEAILDTAKRELHEETGAVDFTIKPICVYSVKEKTRANEIETYGMLYMANIYSFEEIHSEIEKIIIVDNLIDSWTYPLIQPKLIKKAQEKGFL